MQILNTVELEKVIVDDSNIEDFRNQELAEISELLNITREIYSRSKALCGLEEELRLLTETVTTERIALNSLIRKRKDLEKISDPVHPPLPSPNQFMWPNIAQRNDNNCPVCGIDCTGPMGYVCNNRNCPTPRSTCATSV